MARFVSTTMTFVLIFLLTLAMLYLKKILFFEDQDRKTTKRVKILLAGQVAFSSIILIISSIMGRWSTITTILWVVFLIYIYSVIVYSSFKSRIKRKGLAFLLPIPLAIFALSIYNISQVALVMIRKGINIEFNSAIFLTVFFGAIVLVTQLLRQRKDSFIWRLERYTEGKNLSHREEMLIILSAGFMGVSIWLGSFLFENNYLPKMVILTYGFVLALIIIFTIFNFNGRRYFANENQKLQRVLITTMADLVENRDENTGGHIRRTARYVEAIAKELKEEKKFKDILTDAYIEDMTIAAPLHDIGKIHIPDSILDKPARLTDDEFAIMKTHTTAGYNIICQVEKQSHNIEYIQIAKQMAKSHHEWMNGKGYPEGLKDDEIPLCAKILAIADVFDALVSRRCYKEPMPLEKAYAIMKEETGTHFDPEVAAAFFATKDTIEQIMKEDDEYLKEMLKKE